MFSADGLLLNMCRARKSGEGFRHAMSGVWTKRFCSRADLLSYEGDCSIIRQMKDCLLGVVLNAVTHAGHGMTRT